MSVLKFKKKPYCCYYWRNTIASRNEKKIGTLKWRKKALQLCLAVGKSMRLEFFYQDIEKHFTFHIGKYRVNSKRWWNGVGSTLIFHFYWLEHTCRAKPYDSFLLLALLPLASLSTSHLLHPPPALSTSYIYMYSRLAYEYVIETSSVVLLLSCRNGTDLFPLPDSFKTRRTKSKRLLLLILFLKTIQRIEQ